MNQNTRLNVLRQRPVETAAAVFLGAGRPGTGRASGGEVKAARSLYVHVPFCFHKCHYCDFYSIVDTRDRQGAFVERLERELAALAPFAGGLPLETVFVGGGTPSLLRVELWERVLRVLGREFDLSLMGRAAERGQDARATGEFTVECNPETVTAELMGVLAAGGVNRVSVGAQSFEPRHLKTLERWHDPENVARAVELARGAGIARQSVDLIFGIPGQTLGEWCGDLERALALGTTHLSCYNLTYEANTAMTARLKRGEFAAADEELEVEMYRATVERLRAAGLERYEVSNYARAGDEARHNMAYWRQEPWLAAGPAAAGHYGGWRWKNVARLDDYLTVDDEGFAPVMDVEGPDERRALRERLMTGLRLREGVDGGAMVREAGRLGVDGARIARLASRLEGEGMLRAEGGRWSLTDAGILVADGIAGRFMGLIG